MEADRRLLTDMPSGEEALVVVVDGGGGFTCSCVRVLRAVHRADPIC